MPITVTWGDQAKSYVHLKVEGNWEFDEYHRAIAEANAPQCHARISQSRQYMPDNVGIIILVPAIL